MAQMGRPAVYRPKVKNRKHRYQGFVTREGRKKFEAARAELSKQTAIKNVGDGDVMEYLARDRAVPASSK